MKWFWWYFLVIVSVLIAGRVYLHAGFPYTHDGENHLARFANYKLALKEGQFPPRFAPNLLNRYGYPVFNYNYPLANILSIPFSAAHIPYETTFKFLSLIAIGLLVVGVANWLYFLKLTRLGQFAGVLAVVSSPVVINMTFFRGNIGELWAIALMSMVLWQIEQYLQKKCTAHWQIWLWTALLLSHNVTAIFAVPILWGYAATRTWQLGLKPAVLLPQLRSFLISLLLVAWFWVPAIFEKKLIVLDGAGSINQFVGHFATLSQIIAAPIRFGFSYVGQVDTLSFGIGLAVVISLLLVASALLRLIGEFVTKKPVIDLPSWLPASFMATLGFIWLQLPSSLYVWQQIDILKYAQFPWRFGIFALLFSLPLIGWATSSTTLNKPLRILLWLALAIQIAQTIPLKALEYFSHDGDYYDSYGQSTSTQNENRAKDFEYLNIGDWQPTAKIISGDGVVTTQSWRGSNRQYQVVTTTPSTVVEPTMVFAGWETYVDGKLVDYQDSDEIAGRLAYALDAGTHEINSTFTQHTWPRMLGNSISVVTVVLLSIATGYRVFRRKHVTAH